MTDPDELHKQLTLESIYTLLSEGSKLTLEFGSSEALATFKVRLSQIKRRREDTMFDLGIIDETQFQRLNSKLIDKDLYDIITVQFYMSEKLKPTTYRVVDIES